MMLDISKARKHYLSMTVDEFVVNEQLDTFVFEGPYFLDEAINTLLVRQSYKSAFENAFYKNEDCWLRTPSKKCIDCWSEKCKFIDIDKFIELLKILKEILQEEKKTGYRSCSFETPVQKHFETVNSALTFIKKYKSKNFRVYINYEDYPPYK